MPDLTRRALLSAAAASAFSAAVPHRAAAGAARRLVCDSRILEVNGKAAKVFGLGESGAGLALREDERFRVALVNRLTEPTLVHWHGQTPPNAQDGVPGVTQPALKPGGEYHYDFQPLAGSHWMHSHHGLQRQNLLSAPLIVHSREDLRADLQDHTVFLHDFTFRDPEEILDELVSVAAHGDMGAGAHDMGAHQGMDMHGHGPPGMDAMAAHLNDVEYDAYLANDRTLDDPEIVRVERGGRVRLRIVNGASATNFLIDLGRLQGRIVATDGNAVQPAAASGLLPIAMAQRIDVVVQLPAEEGAWPVFAVREGDAQRTGIVLATRNAT
ncbi:MAG: multicopper oxidase domain-containing protein, partial [Rhodospirillales bacterium]